MLKMSNKSPKELVNRFVRSNEAIALSAAATMEIAMIRYPDVVNFLRQSAVYVGANPITRIPQTQVNASHVPATGLEIVMPIIVGGIVYTFAKFLRKEKED